VFGLIIVICVRMIPFLYGVVSRVDLSLSCFTMVGFLFAVVFGHVDIQMNLFLKSIDRLFAAMMSRN